MQITNAAKKYILSLLYEHNYPLLKITTDSNGCCGNSFALSLGNKELGENTSLINDVPVAFDEMIASELNNVVLDYSEEKGLFFPNESHTCSH